MRRAANERTDGFSLVELVMGLTILTIGLLAIVVSLLSAHKTVRSTGFEDESWFALENMRETLRMADFSTVYQTFHNQNFDVPGLQDASGATALLRVVCHVNETALPAEFGPIADLDGIAGLTTTDCSTSYRLLPVQLILPYADAAGSQIRNMYFLLGAEE